MLDQDSPQPQGSPNFIVKIVFEQVDTDEEDIKGCKVYLEMPNRPITDKVLISEDRTVPECWAAEVFDFIRAQLRAKMEAMHGTFVQAPKKDEMN